MHIGKYSSTEMNDVAISMSNADNGFTSLLELGSQYSTSGPYVHHTLCCYSI